MKNNEQTKILKNTWPILDIVNVMRNKGKRGTIIIGRRQTRGQD